MKKCISLLLLIVLLSCATTDTKRIALDRTNPLLAKLRASSCQLWKDPNGVTHAKGSSELNAYTCLGYLHGRDRAFHVDFLRRAAQGRLAEVLGKPRVPDDFFLRLINLEGHAQRVFEEMPVPAQELLWAYSFGINKAFSEHKKNKPYEFAQLGYFPEEWLPQHSVAILLLQAFSETKISFTHEFSELEWKKVWGEATSALTTPDGIPWDTTILKPGEYKGAKKQAATGEPRTLKMSQAVPGSLPSWAQTGDEGKGSNNWVLAPSWSASGNAWLANDPHVELQYPSFWYWTHIQGGEFNAMGATVPGLPLFPSGFNEHMAWGLTDSNMNVADVISVPEDDVADFQSERPTIWFKAGPLKVPFFFKSLQRSKEGYPVLPLEAPEGRVYVLRWTGFLVEGQALSHFSEMCKAKSVEAMDKAISAFALPSFNFVFADTKGGIGYRVTGLIPREIKPTALGPTEMAWKDAVPVPLLAPDEVPHLLQPARGYLVTANNRWWQKDSQFYSGRQWANGFRAFRIEEELTKTRAHRFASLRNIQCDTQIVDGRFLTPKLLQYAEQRRGKRTLSVQEVAALKLLKEWNYQGDLECKACAIYQRWVDKLVENGKVNLSGLYRLLNGHPSESVVGTKFEPVFFESLTQAVQDLLPPGRKGFPTWGEMHRAYFDHVSKDPEFAAQDWLPTPGNTHSVNVGAGKWNDGYYKHTSGASQRLIVELTSPPTAYFSHDGGNEDLENHTVSKNHSSWAKWAKCDFQKAQFPLDWEKVPVQNIALSP